MRDRIDKKMYQKQRKEKAGTGRTGEIRLGLMNGVGGTELLCGGNRTAGVGFVLENFTLICQIGRAHV